MYIKKLYNIYKVSSKEMYILSGVSILLFWRKDLNSDDRILNFLILDTILNWLFFYDKKYIVTRAQRWKNFRQKNWFRNLSSSTISQTFSESYAFLPINATSQVSSKLNYWYIEICPLNVYFLLHRDEISQRMPRGFWRNVISWFYETTTAGAAIRSKFRRWQCFAVTTN